MVAYFTGVVRANHTGKRRFSARPFPKTASQPAFNRSSAPSLLQRQNYNVYIHVSSHTHTQTNTCIAHVYIFIYMLDGVCRVGRHQSYAVGASHRSSEGDPSIVFVSLLYTVYLRCRPRPRTPCFFIVFFFRPTCDKRHIRRIVQTELAVPLANLWSRS